MRESIITKIIAKTYASIVVVFTFISLLFISLFIVLQNGLYLDNVSISNIHAKNIYIKWDNKLSVSVQTLRVEKTQNEKEEILSATALHKYLKIISQATNWFHSIVIHNIAIDNASASFQYIEEEQGFFVLQSPTLEFKSNLYFQSNMVKLTINNFKDTKRSLYAKGNIIFDTNAKKVYAQIDVNIHNDANLSIYALADTKQLFYNIISNKAITDISYLIKIAHLPKEVIYWAYTAIKMQNLHIGRFNGFVTYSDLENAYKNIHIEAVAKNLSYTYNPKLDAVKTEQTNLEFLNGVLYIRPQKATSYGMDLGKSWLKIDFTKKEELLTLHLLFDGKLNKDMLHVLNTYKIKLPFLQKKGKIKTDLIISVNLHTIDVNAKGDFYTKKANFDYLGLNIDIYDTHLHLNNYDVLIDKMRANYKNIAQANLQVTFNAKKSTGIITFDFHKIQTHGLALVINQNPLHVAYNINPKQDTIKVNSSQWIYKNKTLSLNKLLIDFNLDTLQAKIPIVFFKLDNIANGYINGTLNLRKPLLNLDIDLLKLQYSGVELTQTTTPLKVQYDKVLSISSNNDIYFNVNGSEYKAKNLHIHFENQRVYLKHTILEIGQYIKTKVYANYDFITKKAHLSLNNFILKNPKTSTVFYKNNKIVASGYLYGENIVMESQALGTTFVATSEEWILTLNSLANIAQKSDFLQKYKLTDGEISFYKNKHASYTQFDANIHYPYPLLVDKEKKITNYTISGEITKEQKIYMRLNNKVNVKIANDITIKIENSGLNIDAIINATKQIGQSNTKKRDFKLSINALNSYLSLGSNRYAISDTMHLQYYNDILTAQLLYKNGNAGFKLQNNSFHLYGKNFNDEFMEKLFVLSQFKGGSLDFSMQGSLDDYEGVFFIYDTTMVDYVILNNILAFINTVPSLVTFSLPGYNKNGLHVKNAYLKFHAKKGVFTISDIYLESKEIKILGKGNANINNNTIDVVLNLKTDLGSNLSKVPLVGYIIFDGKSLSTTLKIDGKLNDPTVQTTVAKDIIVAPVNIIKRTLTLPYKILQNLF